MSNEEKIPQPTFHLGENFSSAYFGAAPGHVPGVKSPAEDQKLIANLIALLIDPAQRDNKADALIVLRNAKAQQFLVDLIGMDQYKSHRRELIMACWESGLDFSAYLIFFANLVSNCEYPEAMEAVTVIDEMQELTDILLVEKALKIIDFNNLSAEKQLLTEHTVQRLSTIS